MKKARPYDTDRKAFFFWNNMGSV